MALLAELLPLLTVADTLRVLRRLESGSAGAEPLWARVFLGVPGDLLAVLFEPDVLGARYPEAVLLSQTKASPVARMRALSWYASAVNRACTVDLQPAAPFHDTRDDLSVFSEPQARRVRFGDLALSSHARAFVLYGQPIKPALVLRALVRTLKAEHADVFELLAGSTCSKLAAWKPHLVNFIKSRFAGQAVTVIRAAEVLGLHQLREARGNWRRRRAQRKQEVARWTRLFALCKGMRVRVNPNLSLELLDGMRFSPPARVQAQFAELGVRVVRWQARRLGSELGSLRLSLSPGTATMLEYKLGSNDLVRLVLEFHGL
jgi:hypothetical protein